MRKKLLFASAAVLLCFCRLTTAFADEITLNINGSPLITDISAQIISGRVMVPVRAIFEAVGAEVEWDPDMKDITGTKDGKTVIMRVNSIIERIDGVEYEMDVMPVISGGRTLAPARYVAEAFGYSVYWDAETETVDIIGGETDSEDASSVNSLGIDNDLFNNIKNIFEAYIEKISDCTTNDATQALLDEFYDENSFLGLADYSDYYYNTQDDEEASFIEYVAIATAYIVIAKDMDITEAEEYGTAYPTNFRDCLAIARTIFEVSDNSEAKALVGNINNCLEDSIEKNRASR